MEVWLDRVQFNTLLDTPKVSSMVVEAIQHRIRTGRWHVYEFVVMPSRLAPSRRAFISGRQLITRHVVQPKVL